MRVEDFHSTGIMSNTHNDKIHFLEGKLDDLQAANENLQKEIKNLENQRFKDINYLEKVESELKVAKQ